MLLHVSYPPDYPDEAPILDLTAPPDAETHKYFDLERDSNYLLSSLTETIEENLSMAMVFTLVSTVKEAAEQLVADRQEAVRKIEEERILAAEAEDNKRFQGTPVNRETFLKWRDAFRKEMEEAQLREDEEEEAAEKKKNRGKETVIGLTGKQLFERGLTGKADEEEEDDGMPVAGLTNVRIEA